MSLEDDAVDIVLKEGVVVPFKRGKGFVDSEGELNAPEIADWNDNLSKDIDYIIPFDCVARDIQQWILSQSMYPQPGLAFAAALSVVAVAIGRNIAYENLKGNLMFIGLAESGEGKDFPLKCASRVLEAVGLGGAVEDRPASGAALTQAMEENPSLLLSIDEFGHFLSSINGKGANNFAKEVGDIFTKSYTSANDKITGKRTKDNEPIIIKEPNLCLLGMTTERQVFDGLTTADIADGSLARYMIIFGEKNH